MIYFSIIIFYMSHLMYPLNAAITCDASNHLLLLNPIIPIALATSILAALCFGAKLVLSLVGFAPGGLIKPFGSLANDCDLFFLKLFLLTAGVLGVVGTPPAPRTLRSDPF